MGVARKVRTRVPAWPWRDLFGGLAAILFVGALVLLSMNAFALMDLYHYRLFHRP